MLPTDLYQKWITRGKPLKSVCDDRFAFASSHTSYSNNTAFWLRWHLTCARRFFSRRMRVRLVDLSLNLLCSTNSVLSLATNSCFCKAFLSSLPPTLIAEAHVLRERNALQHRRRTEEANAPANAAAAAVGPGPSVLRQAQPSEGASAGASRGRRQRNGKLVRLLKLVVLLLRQRHSQ